MTHEWPHISRLNFPIFDFSFDAVRNYTHFGILVHWLNGRKSVINWEEILANNKIQNMNTHHHIMVFDHKHILWNINV